MKIIYSLSIIALTTIALGSCCQEQIIPFNGSLTSLADLSDDETISICPENFTGAKGNGGMAIPELPATRNVNNSSEMAQNMGQGWKVNPYVVIKPGETFVLADIQDHGYINRIWMTPTGNWHTSILRIYWDGEESPSVECPVGDFFCNGWNYYARVNSLPVCVNPGLALSCYWQMPFRKSCKITIENIHPDPTWEMRVYYQITYTRTRVSKNAAYFHAQHRKVLHTENSLYTILDGVKGKGQYVGTYFAWKTHNTGWWGEGEIKFYLDGDKDFPSICGTGTEDYISGSYDFTRNGEYTIYNSAYAGMCQVIPETPAYSAEQKFGMYRWHIVDPIRFKKDLRITIQDIGYGHDNRYIPQKSQIATTAFWYQTEPHNAFPPLPEAELLMAE